MIKNRCAPELEIQSSGESLGVVKAGLIFCTGVPSRLESQSLAESIDIAEAGRRFTHQGPPGTQYLAFGIVDT